MQNITDITISYLYHLNKLRILKLKNLYNVNANWILLLYSFTNLEELYYESTDFDIKYIYKLIGTKIFNIQVGTKLIYTFYKIYIINTYLRVSSSKNIFIIFFF